MKKIVQSCYCLAIALGLGGCGDSDGKVPVSGMLMHKGQPLGNVVIVFYPEAGGRPVAAESRSDGAFSFPEGAAVGKHKVTLAPSTASESDAADNSMDPYTVENQPKLPVAQKYLDPSTTDLMIEVPADGLASYSLTVPD